MSIANLIDQFTERAPYKKALFYPLVSKKDEDSETYYKHLTYAALRERAEKVTDGLRKRGVRKGTKVLLFVRPSLEFPVLAYALFKIGATAILIDPGMGRKNLFKCIKDVKPEVLIAVPEVYLGKKIFPEVFKSIKTSIIIDQSSSLKTTLAKLLNPDAINFVEIEETGVNKNFTETVSDSDLAAIVFTSGGTGKPKGVEYTHKIYKHQVELLKETYGLTSDDVDLPAFPLFALFTLAMGMTVVIPDMDPTKPAKACPKTLVKHIENHGVTFAGGSPSIWERVSRYCLDNDMRLSSMKSLMMFGAPVAARIHEEFKNVLPNGTTYTPYGATECLPVSTISGKELLSENLNDLSKQGKGTCVGRPAKGTEIKIINPVDGVIQDIGEAIECGPGVKGEIIVKGVQATRSYHNEKEKTALAKISDGKEFWHRMGDMGYVDSEGRLWFCGRSVHSMIFEGERIYSVNTESYFNNHPEVKRTALVNVGTDNLARPALVVETYKKRASKTLSNDLRKISSENGLNEKISDFYFDKSFPVDIRHNIKIDRKKLGIMAKRGELEQI